MSQYDFGDLESPLPGASFINGNLEPWRDALHTCHKGSARPSYAQTGMLWIDDSTDPDWLVKIYDGTQDVTLGTLDSTTHVFTPSGVTAPTAENVSFDPTGTDFTGTDVQAALEDLDSAAFEPTSTFATAAQGDLADTALQPGEATPKVWYAPKTDTASIASSTWTDITGLTVTLTPVAGKSYIVAFKCYGSGDNESASGTPLFRLAADGTPLEQGDAAGSRVRVHGAFSRLVTSQGFGMFHASGEAGHTPADTDPVTYSVQWRRSGTSNTALLNRSDDDSDGDTTQRAVSTISVMEVDLQ